MDCISRRAFAACLPLLILATPLLGQAPASRPDVQSDQRVIDELVIANTVPLNDLFPMLQKKEPSFQYVAKPGNWQSFELPPMHLRNLTIGQVFVLLSRLDADLMVDAIPDVGGGDVLYVLKDRPRSTDNQLFSGQPGYTHVTAFGLAETVDNLALRKERDKKSVADPEKSSEIFAADRKQALDDILSLLQAALAQSSEPSEAQSPASLKLHKETEVLLVKGTDKQIAAVSDALEALKHDLAGWQHPTQDQKQKH